jgi:hypothetical protein
LSEWKEKKLFEIYRQKNRRDKIMTYEISIPNLKYKNLNVNTQILRAFASTHMATVKLFDSSAGILKSHYYVEDVMIDNEVFQQVSEITKVSARIKTIAIAGIVVAKRKTLDGKLLTTGLGWREYRRYLPENMKM